MVVTRSVASAVVLMLLLAGCSVKRTDAGASAEVKAYVPGTGDIMVENQMHHAKLWFAGQDGNWPLAQYELNELREGFDHVKTYHPTFKKKPTAPMIDQYVAGPLDELDKAVQGKNQAAFGTGFDDLTNGCNGCHKEFGMDMNVIQRPTSPPFSNQDFEPARPG